MGGKIHADIHTEVLCCPSVRNIRIVRSGHVRIVWRVETLLCFILGFVPIGIECSYHLCRYRLERGRHFGA